MSYVSLKIFKNSTLLKTKIFTDEQISIGSSEGLNLQLDGLSPWHILIEKKNDVFSILDLGSETGTMLNGVKITDETLLKTGSTIHAGPYEIQFFITSPSKKHTADSQEITSESLIQTESESLAVPDSKPKDTADTVSDNKPSFAETYPSDRHPISGKPKKKGFWNTYAPESQFKSIDEVIKPSIGNLIEVSLVWQSRVLKTYTFSKGGDVFIGSDKKCQIRFPNMLSKSSYKLLSISSGACVYLEDSVSGMLFQGKDSSNRQTHPLQGNQKVTLKPYEMVKLDFNSNLTVCVRLVDKPPKAPLAGLLDLTLSESLALFFAVLLTVLLFFYGTMYAPAFLAEDIDFIEKNIRVAKVVFEKPPQIVPQKVKKQPTSSIKVKKRIIKKPKKRVSVKTPIKQKVKRISTPKKKKKGKMAAVAPGRKKAKNIKKVKLGSARPGGSLKTGKAGSSAKTVAIDPTKVGILGVFGKKGAVSKLDKAASGSEGLAGLADQYTGYGGTKDSYEGEGIGTKTKELTTGGQGGSVIGISGVKTSGKGLSVSGKGRGGLGQRGRMSMEFSSEDIDVIGEIDREGIFRVIQRNRAKFDRCYQLSLNSAPSIQGRLLMRWRISTGGLGLNARVIESAIDNNGLKNCVAKVLESLKFPSPPKGQIPEVTFPFNFSL